ncbi:MAG: hypothetical protein GC158_11080 [Cyanobacteria bacterium RI_101]|nr:hypothetical protein [Cyanobacteria bacterium RI_101]
MDSNQLALLQADIKSQQETINRVFTMLENRAQNLTPDKIEKLESVAYQIHNFYCAVEELLKIVAIYFENNISDTAQWHSLLLKRMTQPVVGVRPALLSWESYEKLNSLRAFRHFFRHAYGILLDLSQLEPNLDKSLAVKPILDQEILDFLELLKTDL